MKTRAILSALFALFIFTTACQKKDNARPVNPQENQAISKTVPVDQVNKLVGIWGEDLDEIPFTHLNILLINPPNDYGEGDIVLMETKVSEDESDVDPIRYLHGNYFTYEVNKESIPNFSGLEEKYDEFVCGLGLVLEDGTNYNYYVFRKFPEGETIPDLYMIDNTYDGSSDPSPRLFFGDRYK